MRAMLARILLRTATQCSEQHHCTNIGALSARALHHAQSAPTSAARLPRLAITALAAAPRGDAPHRATTSTNPLHTEALALRKISSTTMPPSTASGSSRGVAANNAASMAHHVILAPRDGITTHQKANSGGVGVTPSPTTTRGYASVGSQTSSEGLHGGEDGTYGAGNKQVIYRGPWLLTFRLLVRFKVVQLLGIGSLTVPFVAVLNNEPLSWVATFGVGAVVLGSGACSVRQR